MTYGKRLDQAIKLAKSTRKALGSALEISEQAVGMVVRGDSGAFNVENSAKAARFLRIDHHWLATGEGEARPKSGWPFLSFGPAEYFELDDVLRQEVEDRLLGAIVRTHATKERRQKRPKAPAPIYILHPVGHSGGKPDWMRLRGVCVKDDTFWCSKVETTTKFGLPPDVCGRSFKR